MDPMDLDMMREKLRRREYNNRENFLQDLSLIVYNSSTLNGEEINQNQMVFTTPTLSMVGVKLTRIMSPMFHCIHALYSTHTNTTYRCHKATALATDVTSNLLGGET